MTYRWDISDLAVGYDAAAEVIHPHYVAIQDEILRLIGSALSDRGMVVDLGGGSGRLMERILDRWPQARGVIVDQSEPFLALAERRLARFGERVSYVKDRLQGETWAIQVPGAIAAFVSMSAIHHLDPAEKAALYRRGYELLGPAGVLLNGDEVRAIGNDEYLSALKRWAEHMQRHMASGAIPATFHDAPRGWIERNIGRFGQPKKSGDDCHETVASQLGYLRDAGFVTADCPWQREMWAVMRGVKANA